MTTERVQQLREVLVNASGLCAAVDENVWRCERKYENGTAFAVVFVDLSGRLPATQDELLGLEERYVAKPYFEGPKHLKWNHYYVFVIPPSIWNESLTAAARKWIECDTTYAKKIVLSDGELAPFFAEAKWRTDTGVVLASPRDVWLREFASNDLHLDRLLFAKSRAPAVRRWLDTGMADEMLDSDRSARRITKEEKIGEIAEIKWTTFRRFPERKHFNFSRVNLIRGVNGVGKTSLLEAIEHFYCGELLRTSSTVRATDVTGRYSNSVQFSKPPSTESQKRERELRWFGAYWRKKQELAKSFGRYIFYNSDAAYQLQQSTDSHAVNNALMNVALGENAADLWGRINEYFVELQQQASQLNKEVSLIRSELKAARSDVQKLSAIPSVATTSLQRVQASLGAIAWRKIPVSPEEFEATHWNAINEAIDLTTDLRELPKVHSTVKQLKAAFRSLTRRKDRLEGVLRGLEVEEDKLRAVRVVQEKLLTKEAALRRVREYQSVGWLVARVSLAEEMVKMERYAAITKDSAQLKEEVLHSLNQQLPLESLTRQTSETLRAEEAALRVRTVRMERMRQRLTELEAIISEVRSLSRRFVRIEPNAIECPFCGQMHQPGGVLQKKIDEGAGRTYIGNEALTVLAGEVATSETAVRNLHAVKDALDTLDRISVALSVANNPVALSSVGALLTNMHSARRAFGEAQDRLQKATAVLRNLQVKGFDEVDFRELCEEVFDSEIKYTTRWAEGLKGRVEKEQAAAREAAKGVAEQLSVLNRKVADLKREGEQLLEGYGAGDDYPSRHTLLEHAVSSLADVLDRVVQLRRFCDVTDDADIKALANRFARIFNAAKEFMAIVDDERIRRETISVLNKKVVDYEQRLAKLAPKEERAGVGIAAFERVMQKHSIEKLLEQFINDNHRRISSILIDIHAPKEFAEVEKWSGAGGVRFVRADGQRSRASITEVSTGQRSAIALAIFLTLNEKLSAAPPLIMLDDPVAHVDDLNILAFVDYLREIALTETRQLFFASANAKVASIFMQKFSAFGDDFQCIDLSR